MLLNEVSANISSGTLPVSIALVEDIYDIESFGVLFLHGVELLTKYDILLSNISVQKFELRLVRLVRKSML